MIVCCRPRDAVAVGCVLAGLALPAFATGIAGAVPRPGSDLPKPKKVRIEFSMTRNADRSVTATARFKAKERACARGATANKSQPFGFVSFVLPEEFRSGDLFASLPVPLTVLSPGVMQVVVPSSQTLSYRGQPPATVGEAIGAHLAADVGRPIRAKGLRCQVVGPRGLPWESAFVPI